MTGYTQRAKQTCLVGGFAVFGQRIGGSQRKTSLPPLQHGLGDFGRDFKSGTLRRAFDQSVSQAILGQFLRFRNRQLGDSLSGCAEQLPKNFCTKQQARLDHIQCSLGDCRSRGSTCLDVDGFASFALFGSLALNVTTILLHEAWQGDTDQTTNRASKCRTHWSSNRSKGHCTKPRSSKPRSKGSGQLRCLFA